MATGGLFDPAQIYELLSKQGLLPQRSKNVSPETGEYGYYPALNRIFASDNKEIAAHEFTHAAQSNLILATASLLSEKKKKDKLTPQESQFLDAVSKLTGKPYGVNAFDTKKEKELADNQKKVVDALYFNRLAEKDKNNSRFNSYRTSPNELQAWGVGSMAQDKIAFDPTPKGLEHLNPSFATDFSILMSMYDKLPDSVKSGATLKRKDEIQHGKKWYADQENRLRNATTYEDVYSDPFKPTIK